jgi:hypothetical protein
MLLFSQLVFNMTMIRASLRICVIFLVITFGDNISRAQGLILNIEIDKPEFVEGEEIFVVSTLTNASAETRNCPRFYLQSQYLVFSVVGPDGHFVPYSGDIFTYSLSKITDNPVSPNSSIQNVSNLMRFFHNFTEKGTPFPMPIITRLLPGTYTLFATYKVDDELVNSNTVTFTIKIPTGDDVEVFEILKDKFKVNNVLGKNHEKRITDFTELASKYNNSSYRFLINEFLGSFLFEKGDTVKAKQQIMSLIKSAPNTGVAIVEIKRLNLSGQEKESFMNELRRRDPNSRVVKYVEKVQTK